MKGNSVTGLPVQHGFLSRDEIELLRQVKDMITEMRKEKRFGVIAVKNEFVSESDLNLALKTQKCASGAPDH